MAREILLKLDHGCWSPVPCRHFIDTISTESQQHVEWWAAEIMKHTRNELGELELGRQILLQVDWWASLGDAGNSWWDLKWCPSSPYQLATTHDGQGC